MSFYSSLAICLCLLTYLVNPTFSHTARGPHHPRGDRIVKHHVHYKPTKRESPEKLTHDEDLLHDTEHLQEHLEDVVDEEKLSKMSDEELEFYYFQVHDTDKNSMLDGLEILQAIHHTSHNFEYAKGDIAEQDEDLQYYIELIDRVLAEDDADNDGYLSYPEYKAGRKKEINERNAQKTEDAKALI